MKLRKLGAGALAAAIAATNAGIYAYAQEDKSMEAELTIVKQRISVPEDYTEFTYGTAPDCGKTQYTFTWNKPDSEFGESVSVSVTGKVIKNVSVTDFSNTEWKPSFAEMSNETLIKAAKKHARNINPTVYAQTDFRDAQFSVSLFGNEATLKFRRMVNGALVKGQTGRITVNKNTGELISYSYNWINGAEFSSRDGAIKKSAAKAAYKKLFPIELVYTYSYDWEEQKYVPHLIYRQTDTGFINAFTGKLSVYEDYEYYGSGDDDVIMASKAVDTNGTARQVTLTASELAEINKNSKFVNSADVLAKLRKTGVMYIPTASEITGETITYDEYSKRYVKNVTFAVNPEPYVDLNGDNGVTPVDTAEQDPTANPISGSFSVNAETGEVLSFSCSSWDTGTSLTDKAAAKVAKSAVKSLLASDKAKKFTAPELTKSRDSYGGYDPETALPIGDPRGLSRTYTAYRVENGVKCADDTVRVVVSNTGYVISYELIYHDGVKFPDVTKKISKSKVYSSYFSQSEFGQIYRCAYDTENNRVVTALVYADSTPLYIDALTGKLTNADGSEIPESEITGEYTDLDGSKYKEYAEKLAIYGIKLMDSKGRLNAKGTITFGDLNKLLSAAGLYYPYDANEKTDENMKLTRKLAAQVVSYARFGREASDMTAVFKTKFTDVDADSKYLGCIAFADASGMITGSGSKFRPDAAFTRGDALVMIYNYLSR